MLPSVLVIDKSADGAEVSVSVAELLPGVGSVVPLGTLTVAVFTRLPVRLEGTDTLIVYVIEPPDGMFTVWLMLPVPLAVPVAPPAKTAVQELMVVPDGALSATVAPTTLLGPALLTTTV